MEDGIFNESDVRNKTRRVLQLMNEYSLMEIEFEDKEDDRMLKLRRDDQEASPPLLEGRSEVMPGQVRAPTVGELVWNKQNGDEVGRGETIAEIIKQDERVSVKAPRAGVLTDCTEDEMIEFGETIARVQQETEDHSEEKDQ
ncbi:MAG: biotin/lipoyl-containing protein [bacterium]